MPKDNENIRHCFDGPIEPSAPQGFSADQMIRCEECLRANPPTRVNCLYCGIALPLTEASASLRKPSLRPPDKHQPGYNSIILPQDRLLPDKELAEAAALLKLDPADLQRIVSAQLPLPLARTASQEEAELVCERLRDLGLKAITVSDADLGLGENCVTRVRSMSFAITGLTIRQSASQEVADIPWSDLVLIVPGRLFVKTVEVKELVSRRSENEILETSQFTTDEVLVDYYAASSAQTWRVGASNFDFSCLEDQKTLIAGENIATLTKLIASRASRAQLDDSYKLTRQILELMWGPEQQTQSRGWRRERPGKYSLAQATVNSNESQFTRYSRLLYYFVRQQMN